MTRIIKFRAWLGNAMEYSVGASQYGHFYCYPDRGDTASFSTTKYSDNIPLMQYTGLLDRNGEKIWEGDILGWFRGEIRVVEWDDEWAYWGVRLVGLEARGRHDCEPLGGPKLFKPIIIGNIYESPELLTNK